MAFLVEDGKQIHELDELLELASNDYILARDRSDTTDGPDGTDKYITPLTLKLGLGLFDRTLVEDGSTVQTYVTTGAILSIADDGDGSFSATIPLDGRTFYLDVTEDIDLLISAAPTPPLIGSAVVYIQQAAVAKTITTPAEWYWTHSTEETWVENNGMYRLILTADPLGNIHASTEVRGTA